MLHAPSWDAEDAAAANDAGSEPGGDDGTIIQDSEIYGEFVPDYDGDAPFAGAATVSAEPEGQHCKPVCGSAPSHTWKPDLLACFGVQSWESAAPKTTTQNVMAAGRCASDAAVCAAWISSWGDIRSCERLP